MADADIAQLGFNVNTGGLVRGERAMDKYAATGEKTERRTHQSAKSMSSSYGMIATAIGTVTAAALSMGKVVAITREFDVLNAQLTTATGNAENAAMAFSSIQDFAATTPYDLAQATKAFTQLVNLGLTPSEAAMESYGNTASAMGKDLSQMVEAVADATTGEFERLKEFGIKASSEGDRVSLTFQGVTTNIGKNAAEIESYLMQIGQSQFAGAMEQRAKTLDGAISNLGDTWDSLFLTISKRGIGDLIKDNAIEAANAIQSLDDYIASGALENGFLAMSGRLDNYLLDFNRTFEIIGQIVDNSATDWAGATKWLAGNVAEMFKQMPEMARFYIQKISVEIAQWVESAKIDAGVFVDVMGISFDHVLSMAEIKGAQIANAMNPFDDVDYGAQLAAESLSFDKSMSLVMTNAAERKAVNKSIVDDMVNGFALEASAASDAYDKKMSKSAEMVEAYLKEKQAAKEASNLGQFKISPVVGSGQTGGLSDKKNEYQDWLNQVASETNIGKLQTLEDEILNVWLAMDAGDLSVGIASQRIAMLGQEMSEISKKMNLGNPFDEMTKGAQDAMGAMSTMFKSGSKDAQRLGVAMTALNLVQAVGAVLNQASGDPYTAFGRMAAMASAVAALGISLNTAFGSDLSDRSGDVQAAQGMNQWGEKATSMDDSLSTVANATGDLVGINSGMLSALQNMQMSIGGASGMIARGMTTPSVNRNDLGIIDPSKPIIDPFRDTDLAFLGDWIGIGISQWFSGSSKVADEGVKILGGSLNDLLSDVTALSYQEVDYKKWKFGSKETKTATSAVEDSVAQQLSLVFNSLADAVGSGAGALGLDAKNTAEALNSFVVDSFKISLKGLSESEQAEAFNNVFSEIFNDLTASVAPWLTDLQMAGEELGETLARVSTQVSIADLMVERFGVTFGSKIANPEMYAKAADNISMLVGGVEQLSSLTSSFIDNFASDETKLSIHTDALTASLSAVGLALPETASGMWDLMSGLDATTEAGANQLATLLKVGDTADEYYGMLNKQSEAMSNLSSSFAGAVLDIYNLSDGVSQVGLNAAVTAARFGDFSLAEQLNLSDYKLDAGDFASASAFNIAQAEAANKILEISQLSANAASDVQTKQLDTLNNINANIIAAQETTNELLAQQNALQLESSESLDQLVNGQ